jgi:hypothetical protein
MGDVREVNVKVCVGVGVGLGLGLNVGLGVGAGVGFGRGAGVGAFVVPGVTPAIDSEGVCPAGGATPTLGAGSLADAVGCVTAVMGSEPEATHSDPIVTNTAAAIVTFWIRDAPLQALRSQPTYVPLLQLSPQR